MATTPATPATTRDAPVRPAARAIALSVAVGAVVGALTSVAQGFLPDAVGPLANSAGPWVVVAYLLCRRQRRLAVTVACASLALLAMVGGYGLASVARGFAWSRQAVLLWTVAGVVVGPALGVGATWQDADQPWRRGLALAPVLGVLVGEGLYGLLVVGATTGMAWWIAELALGVSWLAVAMVRARSAERPWLAGGTAAAAGGVFVAYAVLGAVLMGRFA